MTTTYSIDDGYGNQIATGLASHLAHRIAQRLADEHNEVLYLHSSDDSENDDPEPIEPTEIQIILDGPSGPRVLYGAQDAERVEAEIPEGWTVDWSSAIDLTVTGTHSIRHEATLVRVCGCGAWSGDHCQWSGPSAQMVTVEYMPEQHRNSHEAAGNRGSYPSNGAQRLRVSRQCGGMMITHGGEWCSIISAAGR